ncbi:hypothetical protein [Effusibacillus consociatus]|uniref:Uncharacterized protein n=1 Tax=Effusibacillus consociatus TaxID=1117041 RepID=A0ABV9PVH4_9BACL
MESKAAACCKCQGRVEEHHVMCDLCFGGLREQAFSRLLNINPTTALPESIHVLKEQLQANFARVEQEPAVEGLRTRAAKYFLSLDYPNHYRFKE